MPIGPFRTYSQPVNLRDLEARFEAGDEVTPEALKAKRLIEDLGRRQDPRHRRADEEALGLRARLLEDGEGEDRGRRRDRHVAARRARPEQCRSAAEAEGDARRDDEPEATSRRRTRQSRRGGLATAPRARTQTQCSPGSPTPGASRSSGKRVLFTALILAALPARVVDPRPGRRLGGDRRSTSSSTGGDPRPAQPLLRRRAVAVLAVRARDHAVRHGVDHPPADDRRHPAALASCRRRASPATPRSTSTRAT